MNTRSHPVDNLLEKFRREHPFTLIRPEVQELVRAAYETGIITAEVDNWIPNP